MKRVIGKLAATTAFLFVLMLPAHSAVVSGQLLGIFASNDSVDAVFDNLNLEVTLLARVETPSSIDTGELSSDGLTISGFVLNSDNEALTGEWAYDGPEIASIIVVKSGRYFAVYAFDDELTNNMPNIGLFDTFDVGNKGLSHITAYSTAVVPIPAAAWLFGSALLGLVGLGRRS